MQPTWYQRAALAAAFAGGTALVAAPSPVSACGGFFCSSANPVNQAAEQIVFADNGDGTVTAIIQIMYEGPSERFAWVLPVPGVPEVEVSSNAALASLQQQTNPSYRLNTVFGDSCNQFFGPAAGAGGGFAVPGIAATPDAAEMGPAVTVQGMGTVGPFDWVLISVDTALSDRAEVAVDWLSTNGYDVTSVGPDVLRPYLDDDLNLLAFRLTKGNSAGSIRPVMITYESELPMIPIRPTAVAANDDMGVMVWTLSDARGVAKNYKTLELNEALIDWFNPNNNYNQVVSRAADEAQGQGFVTEFAGNTDVFANSIFPDWQRQQWQEFQNRSTADAFALVADARNMWGGWDGFEDALDGALTIPDTLDPADVRQCLRCYSNEPGFVLDGQAFLLGLYEMVIKPMMDTQELIDSRPYMTRLYTTMSAEEMTLDPIFDFNADLEDYSNVHVADRVVECDEDNPDPFGSDNPWTVTLAQGNVVMGVGQTVWPIDIDDQPAALKILQLSTSGQGEVLDDRTEVIAGMIAMQNQQMMGTGVEGTGAGSGGSAASGSGGTAGMGGSSATAGNGRSSSPGSEGMVPTEAGDTESRGAFGCTVARADGSGFAGALWPLGLALLAIRRRRR